MISRIRYGLTSPWMIVFVAWFSATLSRMVKNGISFGLNYNTLQPDGALYHAFTLKILGYSWNDSILKVNEYFLNHIGVSYLPDYISYETEKVIMTRPLYPILSSPFVWFFGQAGMLVVPSLALLALGFISLGYFETVMGKYTVSFIFTLLVTSTSVTRWFISDLTDGLSAALIAAIFLVLIKGGPDYLLLVISSFALMARPNGPLLFALILPFALRYRTLTRIAALSLSILGTLILSLISPEAAGVQRSGEYTLSNRVADFPWHFLKVVIVEFGELLVLDRILLVFIICSLVYAFGNVRDLVVRTYLSLFAMALCLGAWNGALGVNFRYQLPILSILIYLVAKQLLSLLNPENRNE